MIRNSPFERYVERYEHWFDRHQAAYDSELLALDALLPRYGEGLEIGVGSGRFAAPLGIARGLDPSAAMLDLAKRRGIDVVLGKAEALPFPSRLFDFVLMVTTICFVDDVRQACGEMYRVLKAGGSAVLGFVDRDSPLGQRYLAEQDASPFYREATFYSPQELISELSFVGFRRPTTVQTLFTDIDTMVVADPIRSGHGQGGFVALRETKPMVTGAHEVTSSTGRSTASSCSAIQMVCQIGSGHGLG